MGYIVKEEDLLSGEERCRGPFVTEQEARMVLANAVEGAYDPLAGTVPVVGSARPAVRLEMARQLAFGADGLLYVGCRGTTRGAPRSGVAALDVADFRHDMTDPALMRYVVSWKIEGNEDVLSRLRKTPAATLIPVFNNSSPEQ